MKDLRNLVLAAVVLALCACSGNTSSGTGTPDTMGSSSTGAADTMSPGGMGSGATEEMPTDAAAMAKVDCSTVRCAACPEGETPWLKPPNCCKCVPVDNTIRDCSNVRCAACPEGQHPALTPPNCCRCVPN